jgi:nucleoside phosphorylase
LDYELSAAAEGEWIYKMKILLVEDLDQKATEITRTVQSCGQNVEVSRAESFVDALDALKTEQYDVLILDVVLPMRRGEDPKPETARAIISEVVEGESCLKPYHIVCLTAYEERSEILSEVFRKNLAHKVIYSETDGAWKAALQDKVRYVAQRLNDTGKLPTEYLRDVAFVTSSPDVELEAVLELPGFAAAEYSQEDAIYYYPGNWNVGSKNISIMACAAPTMGMTAACVTACKVIQRWRPKILVMTGIAAGTDHEKLDFGDILVAERAYDYGSGKIRDTENGREFIPGHQQISIDPGLAAIIQRLQREQLYMDDIKRSWDRASRQSPRLVMGILASGAAVVQSKTVVDELVSLCRKAIGIDMEAYGIFQAATLCREPRPRVLVAKSVSDYADSNKRDEWQKYAAFTSARFAYHFLTQCSELALGASATGLGM